MDGPELDTGNSPWNDDHDAPPRRVFSVCANEETRNETDVPVPGDPVPCSGSDFMLWTSDLPSEQSEAKRLCAGCWMQIDCREYGVQHPYEFGVWGGRTQRERSHLAGGAPSGRSNLRPARSAKSKTRKSRLT